MKSYSIIYVLLLICFFHPNVEAAKILAFTSISVSHNIFHNSLIFELATRGHEITLVTSLKPQQKIPPNIRLIHIPIDMNQIEKTLQKQVGVSESNSIAFIDMIQIQININYEFEQMIHHPDFIAIKNEKFDLIILGWCINDFLYGLASHFNVPLILSVPNRPSSFIRHLTGNPNGVSYLPAAFADDSTNDPMSFKQRLVNYFTVSFELAWAWFMEYYVHRPMYAKNFPSDRYPTFDESKRKIALVLVSHHFSQGTMEAYLPAMVEVGGMPMKAKPSPLPNDIQAWLDGAPNGVIYFSLGTNIKSSYLSDNKISQILRTFAKLKQRILWKYENDQLPNKPDNVMISKWLPQMDVLAHPNIKLFISHGGLGSVNDAKYHGVPILGIPFFGDQPANINLIVTDGWATSLPFSDLTEETLTKALEKMLTNSSYGDKIKKISDLYKDRPQTAMETAVYWVEYVIRHNGAWHMQSPAVHLNFFQYHSLDVIGFIFICLYVLWRIVKFFVCQIIGLCKSKLKRKTD